MYASRGPRASFSFDFNAAKPTGFFNICYLTAANLSQPRQPPDPSLDPDRLGGLLGQTFDLPHHVAALWLRTGGLQVPKEDMLTSSGGYQHHFSVQQRAQMDCMEVKFGILLIF